MHTKISTHSLTTTSEVTQARLSTPVLATGVAKNSKGSIGVEAELRDRRLFDLLFLNTRDGGEDGLGPEGSWIGEDRGRSRDEGR